MSVLATPHDPAYHEDAAQSHRGYSAPPPGGSYAESEEAREELRLLRQREREIVALLGSASPQRILHDIRNLMNEVQLLRYLAEKND